MTLIPRKPRPLRRDGAAFRDDRLFIVACDDTYAPKQYFDFFRLPRVQIHVVTTTDGTSSAAHVLERLLAIDHDADDERWLLLDVDHYASGRHLPGLTSTLSKARKLGVQVALSKPCFELWLLLHHAGEAEVMDLKTAGEVEDRLRSILTQYNKTRLRAHHFPPGTVALACGRAERLDAGVGGEIPGSNTSRVYRIWKSIASKALPSQLPVEFRSLR